MISVPNRQRLLNGNNLLAFLFLCFLCFSWVGCDALKKVPTDDSRDSGEIDEIEGGRVYNPETGKYEPVITVTETMDTVVWTINSPDDYPPIKSTTSSDGSDGDTTDPMQGGTTNVRLNSYNVAIFMPFLTNRFNSADLSIPDKSLLATHFYAGAKMALDKLSKQGVKLDVTVHDSQADNGVTQSLLESDDFQNSNLIIGPVKKSNLKEVAEFAKQRKIPFVSPVNPTTGVTDNNPYYIQVSPGLKSHCEAITKHASVRYNPKQMVLVARNKQAEINRLKYFQDAHFAFEGGETEPIEEFIVSDQTADYGEMDVLPYMKENFDTTVFIIPSWSNEAFVYSFMRKVNIAKEDKAVVIYGMPQWMDFKNITYDYFERLHVHLSSSSYIDPDSPDIRDFKRKYFNAYGTLPTLDAYKGFDTTLYFGELISDYGTQFQTILDQRDAQMLHTKFDFERVASPDALATENFNLYKYNENKYVNILKFEDYHFQLAE